MEKVILDTLSGACSAIVVIIDIITLLLVESKVLINKLKWKIEECSDK